MRFVFLALLLWPVCAFAETRVALVLGAERYAALRPLANPVNDARAVEQALLDLGFQVTLETNRDLRRMRRALEDFAYDYAGADVALIYFAGHGMEVAGQNMLLPIDTPADSLEAIRKGALPLDEVAVTLQAVSTVGLLILDACRSDPFGGSASPDGTRDSLADRGAISLSKSEAVQIRPGLARVGRADNLLYAFAAAPGQAALDGQGDNSPFTTALTRHLATPGLEIRQVLTLVQQDVYDRTRGKQLPYVESGLPQMVFAGGQSVLPEREVLLLAMAGMAPGHRALIERIAAENDMPLAPLFGAFLSANLAQRTIEDQTAELTASANAFTSLRRDMATLASDDPRVSALRAEAEDQLSLGAFTLARAKLSEAAGIDRISRETLKENYIARTLSEAETHYLNAQAAQADLNRDLAIADYERAVALFEEVHEAGQDAPRSYLRALDSLGLALRFQGNTQRAYAVVQAMASLTAAQLADDPDNTEWMRDHSVSFGKLGALALVTGDLAGAMDAYKQALILSANLAEFDPDNTQWQRDFAISYNNIGEAAMSAGKLAAARDAFERAYDITQALLARDPDNLQWRRDLGISHERLGVVALAEGDVNRALRHHQADLENAQWLLARAPDDADLLRGLALAHAKLGDVARSVGDLAAVQRAYNQVRVLSEELVARDSGNTQWQRDLAIAHGVLGLMALELGFTHVARDHYQTDFDITAALVARDPRNLQWRRDLAISHDRMGSVAQVEGDFAASEASYRAALAIRQDLGARDDTNTIWQRDLSISYSKLGGLARETGDMATARDAYGKDLKIIQRLAAQDPRNVDWQLDLAISHVQLFQSDAPPLLHLNAALRILERLEHEGRLPEANFDWIDFLKEARSAFTAQE